MSEYLIGVIGTVIFSALVTAIIPEGKTSGIIKAITKMCCILAIVSPVLNFFRSGKLLLTYGKNSEDIFVQSVIEEQGEFIQYYSETRVKQTQTALEKEILQHFGLETCISLEWTIEKQQIKIIRIVLNPKKQIDGEMKENMAEYLMKSYCSEVLIE